MAVLVILFITAIATSGAIGYFLAYLKNERELGKKSQRKYNPKAGWYAYC